MPTTASDHPHWFRPARPVVRPAATPAGPESTLADRPEAPPTPPPSLLPPPYPARHRDAAGDDAAAKAAAATPRPERTGLTLAAVGAVVGTWLLVLVLATTVQVSSGLQDLARFGHLAADGDRDRWL